MQAFMKLSLDYIEQNLKAEITAEELADIAGYSLWHYYRLFSQATGSSVLSYILKRRLDHALAEISTGRKAIGVVLEYGFATYAGFYKAFMKMYGVSPKKYLSIYGKHQPIKHRTGDFFMKNTDYRDRPLPTEGELRRALANWGIEQDLPIKKRSIACMDGNTLTEREWKIGDKYVLTMDERSLIMKDIRIKTAFAAHGLGAAPLKTKSGADWADGNENEAEFIFILTPAAKGIPLVRRIDESEGKYREFGYKHGVAIAKIHRVLSTVESDIMPDEWGIFFHDISDVRKSNEQFNIGLTEEFFRNYMSYTENFGELSDKLPKQLVCWNTHPCNILFDDNGEVSGFQFLPGGRGARTIRIYDLCECANEILGEWSGWWRGENAVEDIHGKWTEILAGILQGYDSINPLTDEEKEAAYYVMRYIKLNGMARGGSMGYTGWYKTNCDNLLYMIENEDKFFDMI